jgi:hypothetical protein
MADASSFEVFHRCRQGAGAQGQDQILHFLLAEAAGD